MEQSKAALIADAWEQSFTVAEGMAHAGATEQEVQQGYAQEESRYSAMFM